MLGFAVEDLGLVRERAQQYKAKGYTAQKWFFRHGPMSGHEGLRKNVALVRTLRETLGEDYDIMLDCWQSMNLDYAVDLCSRIEEYRPRWLEEPFMPDRIDSHVRLKAKTRIPLSGAEHEYTRWGFKRFVEKEALDILQPDIYWCGGLSETLKIAALRDRPRPDRDPARPLDADRHPLLGRAVADPHALPGVPGEVERDQHALPQASRCGRRRAHPHARGAGAGMALDPEKIEEEEEMPRWRGCSANGRLLRRQGNSGPKPGGSPMLERVLAFKERLRAGDTVIGAWLGFNDPALIELMAGSASTSC